MTTSLAMRAVLLGEELDEVRRENARLQAQIATLRAWMAEYPNDKYTGAWWLAEFDRIVAQEETS